MSKTIAEKILSEKSGSEAKAGDIVVAQVNLAFVQDTTGPLTVRQFKAANFKKLAPGLQGAVFLDHAAPSQSREMSNDHMLLRKFAADTGAKLHDVGDGVCHQLVAETLAKPGDLIIGSDSHTVTAGALGAFACGMGSSDVAVVFGLGRTWFRVPESFLIEVSGKFSKGVFAKDLVLSLIGQIGADGATYKSLEFSGAGLKNLSIADRLTVANMAVEAGAKVGLFPADEITHEFLVKMGRGKDYKPITPDAGATYERKIHIDLAKVEPMVSRPHTVDNTVPVKDIKGLKIQQVLIGTCTNGRLEDIEIAARILKGKKRSPQTRVIITPASRRIMQEAIKAGYIETLLESGAAVMPPGCGACLGLHQGVIGDGEACLSTANRNFKGRMGSAEGLVFLSSPATAAASAITGVITDPREFI
ncbi:MAG TPA: 3-isopropylmalate dehydratase large subunit [Dehalococcoidales bacterium]|nr:3-isopropylmalate dehydratase large subunit [Dehalococcoidales bacterium]